MSKFYVPPPSDCQIPLPVIVCESDFSGDNGNQPLLTSPLIKIFNEDEIKCLKSTGCSEPEDPSNVVAKYVCELCNQGYGEQFKFYEHLKGHYEDVVAASSNNPTPTSSVYPHPSGYPNSIKQDVLCEMEDEISKKSENHVSSCDVDWNVPGSKTDSIEETSAAKFNPTKQKVSTVPKGDKAASSLKTKKLQCPHCCKNFRKIECYQMHLGSCQEGLVEKFHEEKMGFGHNLKPPGENETDLNIQTPEQIPEFILNSSNDNHDFDEEEEDIIFSNICPTQCENKESLDAHILSYHPEVLKLGQDNAFVQNVSESDNMGRSPLTRSITLKCHLCDRVFKHRNSLIYHLRGHSGDRRYECETCGKRFFATSALKVHVRQHSGEKPCVCQHCGRRFRQLGDLRYHLTSIHSEEKAFQCEYCGKNFARKYSLVIHRRIHTGERNYRCEICSKGFRAAIYLSNHKKIHTGEKPHACHLCQKGFRVRSDLKRHLLSHEKNMKRVEITITPLEVVGDVDELTLEVSSKTETNSKPLLLAPASVKIEPTPQANRCLTGSSDEGNVVDHSESHVKQDSNVFNQYGTIVGELALSSNELVTTDLPSNIVIYDYLGNRTQ